MSLPPILLQASELGIRLENLGGSTNTSPSKTHRAHCTQY